MFRWSDALYVRDIKAAIEAIFSYIRGITFDDFKFDRMRYSAVIREFELIGEAVGNLADNVKENYPHIAWQDIKDFRNLLIHEYFGVDLEIVGISSGMICHYSMRRSKLSTKKRCVITPDPLKLKS